MRRYIVVGLEGPEEAIDGGALWLKQELEQLAFLYGLRVFLGDPVEDLPRVIRWQEDASPLELLP